MAEKKNKQNVFIMSLAPAAMAIAGLMVVFQGAAANTISIKNESRVPADSISVVFDGNVDETIAGKEKLDIPKDFSGAIKIVVESGGEKTTHDVSGYYEYSMHEAFKCTISDGSGTELVKITCAE